MKKIKVGIIGNPNCGKTTIFNALTGFKQHVGNWPGVTVEKKEGTINYKNFNINIVDLPGTYSLTPYSIEEVIVRDFIVNEKPDVIINIIDASNFERNFYLTSQLIELNIPILIVLNMMDIALENGIIIDTVCLETLLRTPVIKTIGTKEEGISNILDKIIEVVQNKNREQITINYGIEIEKAINNITEKIKQLDILTNSYPLRWFAIKLLEKDNSIIEKVKSISQGHKLISYAQKESNKLENRFDEISEIILANRRYGFINGIVKECVKYVPKTNNLKDLTDKIDKVLLNKYLGLPILFLIIWLLFQSTFTLGAYPTEWLDKGIKLLSNFLSINLPDSEFKSFLIDGIISGVGSIVVFIPNIMLLFIFIAILEESGYMTRAAFLMDKIMHLMGLHGKSFIPMIVGFGCNVPAIMCTRILESHVDRLITILITPFMSCSARLPVYVLFAGAFFGLHAGNIIFLLYLIGILLALITARLLKKVFFKKEDNPFIMELPLYHVPSFKLILINMWEKTWLFIKKIGGVILLGSIVIWFLSYYPKEVNYSIDYNQAIERVKNNIHLTEEQKTDFIEKLNKKKAQEKIENSYAARIGKLIEPLIEPIGFDWRNGVALISGFIAKETVISTHAIIYQINDTEDESLKNILKNSSLTPFSAFGFMLFVLIYTPCLGTLAAIKKETNSWKWTIFSIVYSIGAAYLASFIVYRIGILLGYG